MPLLIGAEWMAIDPSLWRVRVSLSEDPCEELWRARLRRRRSEPADAPEPLPELAPFFGEATWSRNGDANEARIVSPDGKTRWDLPFPNPSSMVFPLRPSARLWIHESLPDGRLWHAYFAEPDPQAQRRAPLKALAALVAILSASRQPSAPRPAATDLPPSLALSPAEMGEDAAIAQWTATRSAQRIRKRRAQALAESRAETASSAESAGDRIAAAGLDPELDQEAAAFAAEFLLPNDEGRQ